jgi:hypothetical protein
MNKDAILTFIKKNILSLVSGLVAILAVVATFYPLGGWISTLQEQANTHAQDYNTLNGFISKPRKLPVSDPNKAEPGDLPNFPNAPTLKVGTEANARWVAYSQQMLKDVRDMNQAGHQLLVADELPNPQSEFTSFYFAKLYKLVLSTDPAMTMTGDAAAKPAIPPDPTLASAQRQNLQNDILHGGLPPTIDEIKNGTASLWKDSYQPLVIEKNGTPVNLADLQAQFQAEAALLPQKMKGEAAKKFKIYVEKEAFTVSPTIQPDVKPQPSDMWYAQMQLWIQQDLCTAIAEENTNSANVLDAPVKRLLAMQVPPAPMYSFPPATAGGAMGQPGGTGGIPATADDTQPIPPIFTVSPTGRYSNGMYDVVPFKLTVDLDATKVNEFIEKLSNQRLITVTNENEYALDAEVESSKGYLYGPVSTVRLQLEGEILFLRAWTQPLMPERVQVALGLVAAPAGTAGPGGPGGPMGMPGMGGPGGPNMVPPPR